MALDEALLLGRLRHGSPPTLRFFGWAPPTISLGYAQRLDDRLVGSAQRRQGAAFLQHGAIMLGAVPRRLRRVFPGGKDPLADMTTLETVLGRRPSFDEAASSLSEGFRTVHGLTLDPGGLSEEE